MGRKIKHSRRDSAPTILVAVGAESFQAPWDDPDGRVGWILGRAVVAIRRRTRKGWTPPREVVCPGWRDVWDVIDSLGAGGRRVYVVAGRASDALTMLHWWDRVESGELSLVKAKARKEAGHKTGSKARPARLHPLVMHGRPDVIGYSHGNASFTWVSVTNWCDVSLPEIASQIGYHLPSGITDGDKWESTAIPAEDQARCISGYMVRLIDWWLTNGCGTWRDTPGASAWASFLRRTRDSGIIRHDDHGALALEDRACFGGRVSAWYYGDVGYPSRWAELADSPPTSARGHGLSVSVHRLDCRSMYPSLMSSELFPVALIRWDERGTLDHLRIGLKSLLAVARVLIRTDRPVYPRRVNGMPQYPVGTFATVLTTPDLRRALAAGHILSVADVAWYTPGRPFAEWAEWALALRKSMKGAADPVGEAVVKLLSNSLSGRLARVRQGWTDRPRMIPVKWWGDWWGHDRDTGECTQFRALAGRVQQMTRDTFRPGTLGACYAHLTAYGRCLMDSVRDVAGKRHVLWQDTDGVFVTDTGRKRIESSQYYHPTEPGKLRYERSVNNMRILTPKHYWCDGQWVLSGIHDGFKVIDGTHAEDVVTTNPARSAVEPKQAAVYRAVRRVDLRDIEPGTEVGPDGWAIPPVARMDDATKIGKAGQLSFPEIDE